ncbi:MAG: hypothetical protein AB7G87_03915 [Clostridia bacterium]
MKILLSYNVKEIQEILELQGFTEDKILFTINKLDGGKYDVTLGFNPFGEDICSKKLDTYLDAYRFVAIRTLLHYDIKSY